MSPYQSMITLDNCKTHPFDELLPILANDAPRELDAPKTDILIHLLHVLRVERAPATAHLEQQHAETPKVNRLGISLVVEQDFGREVLGRTAECVGELVGFEIGLGEPKVAERDVSCCVEEDVLGFQVTEQVCASGVRESTLDESREKGTHRYMISYLCRCSSASTSSAI